MATFNISTSQNMTQLTGKTWGDTYNINGGSLIIDSDTRYWPNVTESTWPFGNVNISSSLGGTTLVSGLNTWIVSYNLGTGVVPASGTTVTFSGWATAELMCVMQNRVWGTVRTVWGNITGWSVTGALKLRNLVGTVASGETITGVGFTWIASSASERGWIEVVWQESLTWTIPRLGTSTFTGDWFEVSTTNGTAQQSIQLPAFGADTWYAWVWIETSAWSGTYEFYPNAASEYFNTKVGTDARSKVVGITSTGVLWIWGNNSQVCWFLPPSGCKIRIANIILSNSTSAARASNVEPNVSLGNRYEFSTSASGNLIMDKVTSNWYINVGAPFTLDLRNMCCGTIIYITKVATPLYMDNVHVWQVNTNYQAFNALYVWQSYDGGIIKNCSFLRWQINGNSDYVIQFVNLDWFTMENITSRACWERVTATAAGTLYFNTCNNTIMRDCIGVWAKLSIWASTNSNFYRFVYADRMFGTTGTTNGSYGVDVAGSSTNILVDWFSYFPWVANVHPYLAPLGMNTVINSTFKNFGTAANPLTATVNLPWWAYLDNGNNVDSRIAKFYMNQVRSSVVGTNNSSFGVIMQNIYATTVDKDVVNVDSDSYVRWLRTNPTAIPASGNAVYGTHFYDYFTSDTTSVCWVQMNERTTAALSTAAYAVTAGNPKFTATSNLSMQAWDQVEWYWPYYILGWNSITNLHSNFVNPLNFSMEYAIDTGSGFSAWKTLTQANVQAEAISATAWFKPKFRITCNVSNTTNIVRSIGFLWATTLAVQQAALYPESEITTNLTFSGLKNGSEVRIFRTSDDFELSGTEGSGTSFTYQYVWTGTDINVYAVVFALGYLPIKYTGLVLWSVNQSVLVQQTIDRQYYNP